jgi:hypothetical protein
MNVEKRVSLFGHTYLGVEKGQHAEVNVSETHNQHNKRNVCEESSALPLIALDAQTHCASWRHDLVKDNDLGPRLQ